MGATTAASSERDRRIDALKGFAILCVVAYHALGQYYTFTNGTVVYDTSAIWLRAFLFSFMLPLFAFLSGYVLGRPGGFRPNEYFAKRTFGLMVPFLAWEVVYGPTKHPEMLTGFSAFFAYLGRVALDPHYEGRMWYLYVLWLALMLLGVTRLFGDRWWAIVASMPAVYLIGSFGHFHWLRWIYIFVALGVLYRRFEHRIRPQLTRLGTAAGVAFVLLWLISEPEQAAAERASRLITSPLGVRVASSALAAAPILTGACAVLAIIAASYHVPERLREVLSYLGVLSLGIYVIHFPFVEMWAHMPMWFLPVNVALALAVGAGWTLALRRFRPTASLLLGEAWVGRPRLSGDIRTETS